MFSTKPPGASGEPTLFARLPALDGLRGIAVLFVLLDHASDSEMYLFPGADLNRLGKYGVYLFFVLSAFLLTHQFHRRPSEELTAGRTWREYAWRRFLRIFPLYTLVLLAMIAMEKLSFTDLWTHLLLQDGRRVFWTIAVEVKFYMLLPLLVLALFWAGRRRWWLGVLASAGAVTMGAGFLFIERGWSLHSNVLLAPNLAPFLMGAVSAIIYGRLQLNPPGPRVAAYLELVAMAALLGVLVRVPSLYNLLSPGRDIGKLAYDAPICGALWSVVILGTLQGRGWLAQAMTWVPLRYLGWISFSAYLWHWKFLSDVDDLPVPPLLRLLVFLGIVVAISSVSYFLVERPLMRIGRRAGNADSIATSPRRLGRATATPIA